MLTTNTAAYPVHGDPREALARRLLPPRHLGTLGSLVPGLVPVASECEDLPPSERALHKRLSKLILDAGDAMNIPRAEGAYQLALALTDRLYDARRHRMRVTIPCSTTETTHPGTVLIAAIGELALALRTNPVGQAPFDIQPLLAVSDWLGGYCELFPLDRDCRRVAPHRLYALMQQLVAYYA